MLAIKAKKKRLAPKREQFKKKLLHAWGKGRFATPTEIAMQVFNCKDRLVARNIASENLAKLGIEYSELLDRMGLTNEKDVEDLVRLRCATKLQDCDIFVKSDAKGGKYKINRNSNDFVEVDDFPTQLRALELTAKLKGQLGNGKNGTTTVNVNVINKVVVDVIGVIKQHVKDPVIRNRIAEDLRQLS